MIPREPLPTLGEWVRTLGLKGSGRNYRGPCPLCGGVDRFHATERDGRTLVGCRQCLDLQAGSGGNPLFGELLRKVFPERFPATVAPPDPGLRDPAPVRDEGPGRRDGNDGGAGGAAAKAIIGAAMPVDGTPAFRYLVRRRACPEHAAEELPDDVRWLPAGAQPPKDAAARWWGLPPGAPGAIVFAYRKPDGGISAVSVEALTQGGRRYKHDGKRWRRTIGTKAGARFLCGQASTGNGGIDDVPLVICEGEVTALAASRLRPDAEVWAVGGTAGMAAGWPVADGRDVILDVDGDAAGRKAARESPLRRRERTAVVKRPVGMDAADVLRKRVETAAAMVPDADPASWWLDIEDGDPPAAPVPGSGRGKDAGVDVRLGTLAAAVRDVWSELSVCSSAAEADAIRKYAAARIASAGGESGNPSNGADPSGPVGGPVPDHQIWLHMERGDTARVLHYADDRFLKVVHGGLSDAYIQLSSGMFASINERNWGETRGEFGLLVEDVRDRALTDAPAYGVNIDKAMDACMARGERHDSLVCSRVANRVSAWSRTSDRVAHSAALNNRDDAPLLPVIGRGALDLRTLGWVSPGELAAHRFSLTNWQLPEPRMELLGDDVSNEAKDAWLRNIGGRFGAGLMRRLARHLIGPSRCVDVVVSFVSGHGKTTLANALQASFPGIVSVVDATKALSMQGAKFSVLGVELTRSALVVVDESDKVERVPTGMFNSLTGRTLSIEEKHVQAQSDVRRTGNIVLLGGDWPRIEIEAQGVGDRCRHVFSFDETADRLSIAEAQVLLSDQGIDFLRAWMVREAHLILRAGDDIDDAEYAEADIRERFVAAVSNPVINELRTRFRFAPGSTVPTGTVSQAIEAIHKDHKLQIPHTHRLKALMRLAFGDVVRGRWVWHNLEETEPDDDPDLLNI